MFDRLTSFSIFDPPAVTELVLLHRNAYLDSSSPNLPPIKAVRGSRASTTSKDSETVRIHKRTMSSHYRSSSPGSRRIANPARMSDSHYAAVSAYGSTSPRNSTERVIPISTTTFLNPTRPSDRVDTRSGRPHRSSLNDPTRPSSSQTYAYSRPAIVQSHADRPSSPLSRTGRAYESTHNPDYYITPASTSRREHSHKKVYSIDDGKTAHLVADIDMSPTRSSGRHSVDRHAYRGTANTTSASSHRNSYHLSGPQTRRKEPVDLGAKYTYTDPADMYATTEPTEPRRRVRSGSIEAWRRPSSMILDNPSQRASVREAGPPTSRALHRYNDGLGPSLQRGGSLRDPTRAPLYPSYQESPASYSNLQDRHQTSSSYIKRPSTAVHQERPPDRRGSYPVQRETALRDPYDERRDLREPDRVRPPTRDAPRDVSRDRTSRSYEDRSVERRGFGIRNPSPDTRGPPYGSDETLNRRTYPDRGTNLPPDSRTVAPSRTPRDNSRREQERREYDYPRDVERQDRDRTRDQEYRESDRKARDRPRDVQSYIAEGERERTRPRRDPPVYHDQDQSRRDTDRRVTPPQDSAEGSASILPPAAAIGGLGVAAVAAGAYGAKESAAKHRDHGKYRDRSPPDHNRDEERSRRHRDQRDERIPDETPSSDRGQHLAPTNEKENRSREISRDCDVAESNSQAPVNADEEYRRRVQQAQREIATSGAERPRRDQNVREPSPDKEYRRRRRSPDEDIVPSTPAAIVDRGESTARDTRVRIVDPPSSNDDQPALRGILRRPTAKFPEDPHPIREGVAPLKDASKDKDIPLDARWTKISRELVNPDCLIEAKERFEEREDCVIVLRVLTKDDIQKLADRTAELRYARYTERHDDDDPDRARHDRRRRDKKHDRRERDEYSDNSEDEYESRAPRLLEGPSSGQESSPESGRSRRRDRQKTDREAGGGRDSTYPV